MKQLFEKIQSKYPPMMNPSECQDMWAEFGAAVFGEYLGGEISANKRVAEIRTDLQVIVNCLSEKEKKGLKKILSKEMIEKYF